ncbi:MAG: serine/threonine-protein kinase, partial [Bacteroidetes bacterium]|nr:serine/threonine-protein kinase [Bacteroidota bacterium]
MVHARDRFRRRPALQAAFFMDENLQAVKLRLSPLSPIYWVQPIIFLLSRTRMTGEIIAQYEILEEIGRGGMGVVYKARDTKLDRFVALKFLPPYLTQDTTARERFIGEAKAAAAIEHNHICTIHDIAESEDGRTYIVMSYYSGVALNERIGDGPVPSEEAIRIGQQTASALAAAHSAGITHRDIKPGNLILTDDGDVKMVDFGLAK